MTSESNVSLVKVSSHHWIDGNGCLHVEKRIRPIKPKSVDCHLFAEEVSQIGDEVVGQIVNRIADLEDGTYSVHICETSTDYETGYLDDWRLKLVKQ